MQSWVQTDISAVHPDGAVEVRVKPGAKIPLAEQAQKLRKVVPKLPAEPPPLLSLNNDQSLPPMPTWANQKPKVPRGLEPKTVLHPRHKHHLTLHKPTHHKAKAIWHAMVGKETHECDVCARKHLLVYYRCDACDFDLCTECAKSSVLYSKGDEGGVDPLAIQKRGRRGSTKPDDKEVKEFVKALYLASSVGGEQTMSYLMNRHFDKFDTNGDKRLSKHELGALIESMHEHLGLPSPQETLVAMFFANFDSDNSGFIEFAEFEALYRRLTRRLLSSYRMLNDTKPNGSAKLRFDEQFELGKRLNAGAQGVTYLATEKATGDKVVVKKPNDCADTSDFDALKDKSHPNIVRVYELFTEPHDTYVVMEFCGGGDLFGALEYCGDQYGGVTYNLIAGVMQQVMRGVFYIHTEFKQCHNDIKPENVLLERKPTSLNDIPRCMVADFGCAAGDGSGADGDPRYNAPELWKGGCVTYASDVWALGVMLFEMLSGGLLVFTDHANLSGWKAFIEFEGGRLVHKLMQAMHSNQEPNWSQIDGGPEGNNLCRRMLALEPQQRIGMRQALVHPWFEIIKAEPMNLPEGTVAALRKRAARTELKLAVLGLVASRLHGECMDRYRSMWEAFDTQQKGTIDAQSFIRMLTGSGLDEQRAREILELADGDKSGHISFTEFVAVMLDPDELSSEHLETQLRSIFYRLAGADGTLTFRELAAQFPEETSVPLLQRLFTEMDQDCNGQVSYSEFSDFLASM